MTEKEYRQLEIDSYSSLSAFIKDRKKYAKKYIYKDKVDEEDAYHFRIGSLVDCLLLTPKEFDERYIVSSARPPIGQMLTFVECLARKSFTVVNGWKEARIINKPLGQGDIALLQEAYDETGFKRDDLNRVIERFETEGRDYYEELVKSEGKSVISNTDYELAKKVEENLRKCPYTRVLMNRQTDDRTTVINQLAIVFKYNGYELKSLLDKVVIDHEKKIIHLYDLKTTFNVEEFEENYYKYNYYLQGALYWIALRKWAEDHGYIDKGYVVEHMEFIVCDSINYMSPLIFTTTEEHFAQAMGGFWRKGKDRFYKGLSQVVSEIEWHKRNNVWNISHDNFKDEGRVQITLGEE